MLCHYCSQLLEKLNSFDVPVIHAKHEGLCHTLQQHRVSAAAFHAAAQDSKQTADLLIAERFQKFSHFLERINSAMSIEYRRLISEGDCYLSYAADPVSLFIEGINVQVQHGNGPWRQVGDMRQ